MRKIAGFGILLAGYTLAWWSYEAITGRVKGTPEANAWFPSLVDLLVPGRLAPNPLSGPTKSAQSKSLISQIPGVSSLPGQGNSVIQDIEKGLAFGPEVIRKLIP